MSLGVALLRRERVVAAGRGKCWLNVSTTAALATMLTACGDHAGATIPTVHAPSATFSHHQTFKFTGKPQRFKVPHVRWLRVVVQGAGGAGSSNDVARGGRVYALIPASIDKELVVYVGGTGSLTEGGYNGGADGGANRYCSSCSYGGGGASDIRLAGGTLGARVIVAGGGGGSGGGSGGYSGGAGGEAAAAAPAEAEAPVPDRATATAPVRAVAADHKAPAGPAVSGAAMIVATAEASVMVEPAANHTTAGRAAAEAAAAFMASWRGWRHRLQLVLRQRWRRRRRRRLIICGQARDALACLARLEERGRRRPRRHQLVAI